MKIRAPLLSLATTPRGDPIRTVNADVAAAELDADSKGARIFMKEAPEATAEGGRE